MRQCDARSAGLRDYLYGGRSAGLPGGSPLWPCSGAGSSAGGGASSTGGGAGSEAGWAVDWEGWVELDGGFGFAAGFAVDFCLAGWTAASPPAVWWPDFEVSVKAGMAQPASENMLSRSTTGA
jgi:hypothetical protein